VLYIISENSCSFVVIPSVGIRDRNMTDNLCQIMQNKANLQRAGMNVSYKLQKDYEKKAGRGLGKNKAKQSQSFGFAQDRFSGYPCVFELAVYNLVLSDGNPPRRTQPA